MKLITLEKYRDLVYAPGSAPTLSTLRRQVKDARILGGRKQVGRYYVDLDANERLTEMAKSNTKRLDELRSDPRLKGLI
jgi:hypothetical protein